MLSVVAAIIAFSCVNLAQAQTASSAISQYKHTRWTIDDDVPAPIFSIVQGKDGYLWIGARDGLFRFDGIHFEKIEPERKNPNRIYMIARLFVAHDGAIWVGYQAGGVAVYRDGVLRDAGLDGRPVWEIGETLDGTIWAGLESNRPHIARYVRGRWDLSPDKDLPDHEVTGIKTGHDGTLWINQDSVVSVLRPGAKKFERFLDTKGGASMLTVDPSGRVWLSDQDGSRVIFPRDHMLPGRRNYPTPGFVRDRVTAFDRDGNLWGKSGTDGIFRLSRPDPRGSASSALSDIDYYLAKDGLASKTVISMLGDREGNLWVGTATSLERFRPVNLATEPALTEPTMFGFALLSASDGTVYVGQHGGIYRIRPGGEPERLIKTKSDPITICEAADHSLWFFLMDDVARFRNEHWEYLPLPPGSSRQAPVMNCAADRNGDLWANATKVRARWTGSRWESFPIPAHMLGGLIIRQPDGTLIGSYGSSSWAPLRPSWTLLKQKGKAFTQLRTAYVRQSDYIAGGPYGLTRVRGEHVDFLSAGRFPILGLTSGLAMSPDGLTWLMTQKGIVRVRTRDLDKAFSDSRAPLPAMLLNEQDGLPSSGIPSAYGTAARGGDGRLWFATVAGIVHLDPAVFRTNRVIPSVVISALKIGNALYRDPKRAVLPAGTAAGEIDFAALSLSVPKRVAVRYKLEGVDSDWVDPGMRRQAFFNNLGPGTYRFRVIAANDDGVWNRQGATLEFTIPPTFLQSNAFKVMCAFVIGLLLWLAYLLRLRQITGRLRQALELRLTERERIARELHDTLLQGIQGLILRVQSVANRLGSGTPLRNEMEQALDQAEAVLVEGRDRVREVRAKTAEGDLVKPFLAVAASMGNVASKRFDLEVTGVQRGLHPLVHQEVQRIGEEAVRNAYAHSSGSIISVRIDFNLRTFTVRISDDGAGIPPEVLAAGAMPGHYGLQGMRERAERIGAALSIESSARTGTEIRISISGRSAYVSSRRFLSKWRRWVKAPVGIWWVRPLGASH